jgi:hypothetical protein
MGLLDDDCDTSGDKQQQQTSAGGYVSHEMVSFLVGESTGE